MCMHKHAWLNNWVLRFFAYIANLMIAHVDAAVYGMLLLDFYCISIDCES